MANVRSDLGKVGDASTYVTGIDPDTILETYKFDWKEGDDSVARNLGDEQMQSSTPTSPRTTTSPSATRSQS